LNAPYLSSINGINFNGNYQNDIEFIKFTKNIRQKISNNESIKLDERKINLKGNINSNKLKILCAYINADFSKYEELEKFINVELVGVRNKYAHGENLPPQKEALDEIKSKTIKIMEDFKDDILNSARTIKQYKEKE
jgi:MAE_28990/MAE_18760-like HEPN